MFLRNSHVADLKKIYRKVVTFLMMTCVLFSGMSGQCLRVCAGTDVAAVRDSLFYGLIDTDSDGADAAMWSVFAAIRGKEDISQEYLDRYYRRLINELEENDWNIAGGRYTEYSKLILMMTAMGKDARDIEGHDLLTYLADLDLVKNQGINGVIYALIAVNCRDEYEIPVIEGVSTQNSENTMLEFMLENEAEAGGWRIMGGYADVDVTAMAIQALAPYYDRDERVREKIDRAVKWLSENQQDNGGYMALLGNARVESSESTSQVVLALTSLGIDPCRDERFIASSGKSMVDRLFEHYLTYDDGTVGFAHILPAEGEPEINGLATVEGFCALTSVYRFENGLSAYYDLRDIEIGVQSAASQGNSEVGTEGTDKDNAEASATSAQTGATADIDKSGQTVGGEGADKSGQTVGGEGTDKSAQAVGTADSDKSSQTDGMADSDTSDQSADTSGSGNTDQSADTSSPVLGVLFMLVLTVGAFNGFFVLVILLIRPRNKEHLEEQSEEQPEQRLEEQSESQPEGQLEKQPEQQLEEQTESQPEGQLEKQPEQHLEEQSESQPEEQSEGQSEER